MTRWKKPKQVYRITATINDDELGELIYTDDILVTELNDVAKDYNVYYDWLSDCKWKIDSVVVVDIWSWSEFRCSRFRRFVELYGNGDELHI